MKPNQTLVLLAALAAPHIVLAEAQNKTIKAEDLPAAVAKAIKEAAGQATLGRITLGNEDGTRAYETTWHAGGHKHEIAVTEAGKVLTLEEIITLAEAPQAVHAAIAKEAGDNKGTSFPTSRARRTCPCGEACFL